MWVTDPASRSGRERERHVATTAPCRLKSSRRAAISRIAGCGCWSTGRSISNSGIFDRSSLVSPGWSTGRAISNSGISRVSLLLLGDGFEQEATEATETGASSVFSVSSCSERALIGSAPGMGVSSGMAVFMGWRMGGTRASQSCARPNVSRPFTGVSGAAGVRPGVYAG